MQPDARILAQEGVREQPVKNWIASAVLLVQVMFANPLLVPVVKWSKYWWTNRSAIVLLTTVNTTLTGVNEYIIRTSTTKLVHKNEDYGFVLKDSVTGQWHIHQHSLINILMTLFASLLGGPVHFFKKRWTRYTFFLGFGLFNSFLSQSLSFLIIGSVGTAMFSRLMFDFVYMGTIKFGMFELGRPFILKLRRRFIGLGFIRVVQDFLTSMLRVGMLNYFGFKG